MQRNFRFYKNEKNEWFIDLPEWKGDAADLQMVEGADKMLDMISHNGNDCTLMMADEKVEEADILTLIHVREKNLGGGGDYLLETYDGDAVNLKLWLCGVTEFVFGKLPQKMWVRKD